jgi:hypothetical protein
VFDNIAIEDKQKQGEIEELDLTPIKRGSSHKVPSTKTLTKRTQSARSPKLRGNFSRRTVTKIAEPLILQQVDEVSEGESNQVPELSKCKGKACYII